MKHTLVRFNCNSIFDFFKDTLVDNIFLFIMSDATKLCYFFLILSDHFILILYVLSHDC